MGEKTKIGPFSEREVQKLIEAQLKAIGEDPKREGLLRTPERVARSFKDLTRGYHQDPREVLLKGSFKEKYNQMVLVKDVDFYSMCEHHMLPFYGKCHVAYIPNGTVIGLSKVPRVIDIYARRLQVQERLTQQIAYAINDVIKPMGVGVVIEAYHLCMAMRGVEKQNSYTTTSALIGVFESHSRTRLEFLNFVRHGIGK